jgi:uncharacterized protein YqiB (DUF1249 family)
MPQLDMFSWFNQVITTTIVMFVFYMFLLLCFLPNTTGIMKGRTKLVNLRNVTITIIMLTVSEYINDVKENLMKLLINNFIPVYSYYYPVNNNQLALNILRTCYTTNMVQIDKAIINASLINVANNINTNINEDNIMVDFEEVESINNLLKV